MENPESIRLRIEETYTDPARYALIDGQLMWHRSFGRPRNDIVLPAGWRVTTNSIPATVSLTDDGRITQGITVGGDDSVLRLRTPRYAPGFGSGSESYRTLRYLVSRLPVIAAWSTVCPPISWPAVASSRTHSHDIVPAPPRVSSAPLLR